MGTIRHRNGKYFVDLTVGGKRHRQVVSKSEKLALLTLRDLELKSERNQLGFLDRKEISLQDFFQEYQQFSSTNHRPATQVRYRAVGQTFLKFMSENFRQYGFLRSVKADHIEKFKIYRRTQAVPRNGMYKTKSRTNRGVKAYTINFEITALKSMFYHAIKMNYLETNPVKGVATLKVDDAQKRRFLSEDEGKKLLQALSPEEYPIFYAYLNTGMRKSELINLEWQDIDLSQKTLKIQRKPFWWPKTSEREIPLNRGLLNVLNDLPRRSSFVFTDPKGQKIRPDYIRLWLIKAAKRAGIPNLTQVHSLRHSFCSQLLQKGVDLPSVQKLMGHAKIMTTMLYTHQTTEHLRNAISKINF